MQILLAAFHSTHDAGGAVSEIIAAGILPAAIEMMDRLSIQAAEAAVHPHYPDCHSLLLVELDGPGAEVESLMAEVKDICAVSYTHLDVYKRQHFERHAKFLAVTEHGDVLRRQASGSGVEVVAFVERTALSDTCLLYTSRCV